MRRCCVLLVSLAILATVAPAGPAGAAEPRYSPPVDGPLIDGWRPPLSPYGPGNRGIDFATSPGEAVRVAADGEVVFAGRVGRSQHVVVLHGDGIRTSYSFLAGVGVRRGDRLVQGDPVGFAGAELHFGARLGDRYLDPTSLLTGPPEVHLVPLEQRRPASEATERRNLLRSLGAIAADGVDAVATGVAWARGEAGAAWALTRRQVDSLVRTLEVLSYYADLRQRTLELVARIQAFPADQRDCTPASEPSPPPPPGRRIAVLVGGFGSASGRASVLDVDTRALGYRDADVAQFSYRGGQSPGPRALAGIPTARYDAADANGDLWVAGERLRDLLRSIRAAHPGVPVDLIAHSQGGVVARAALGLAGDRHDPRLPRVEHVITLGSPHQGTDLATANVGLGVGGLGQLVQGGIRQVTGGEVDPWSAAAGQLAETSSFVRQLGRRPLPAGARVTAIGARGDLTVPALHTALPGATNVVVPLDGVSAHRRLPGSAAVAREMALALAGLGPTCRSVVGDLLRAAGISVAEDLVGAGAAFGNLWADRRMPAPRGPSGSPRPAPSR